MSAAAETGGLALSGALAVYRASELKPLVLSGLLQADAVFDLSNVTGIDTAGVQLLLLARREAEAWGCRLRLRAPSPCVREVLDFLGLSDGWVEGPPASA